MSTSGFRKLADVLPRVYAKIGLAERLWEREISASWEGIVGPDVAARTKPVKLKEGVLEVEVNHGAWLQELRFRAGEVAVILRKHFPTAGVRVVRFVSKRRF